MSFSEPKTLFIKEFVSEADTFVGASSIYSYEDTTQMLSFYDGVTKGRIDWENKTVTIDSFQNHPYPFRLVMFPFYTKTKSIINYVLETKDSIKTDLTDFGDSLLFRLFIYDKNIEFVTKPYNDVHPGKSVKGNICQYDIWIGKSNNLPFRMRKKMPHHTTFRTCSDAKFNTSNDVVLTASDYYPEDFSIIQYKRGVRKPENDLTGKTAPDWTLKDIDGNEFSLKELTSKVLMIQFTGVGCGPCHQSLPFLKQLVEDYKDKDFEFVSIETWSKNMEGLKKYQEKNDFNFKFLKAEEQVIKEYGVKPVPIFFIIDENRVIRKVSRGYTKEKTDKEIIRAINSLM
jgi:peroxiredoxin